MSITINVSGMDAAMQQLNPARIHAAIPVITFAVAVEVNGLMRTYPNQRPARGRGRQYRRTGRLGQGWHFRHDGQNAVTSNSVAYAQWVQGRDTQTSVHIETGWPTDEGIAEQVERDGTVQRIADQYFNRVFTG